MARKSEPFLVLPGAEAVVQADIGGVSIAFTGNVTAEDMDGTLDRWMRAISRQRAQFQLIEELVDLQACRDTVVQAPKLERELGAQRAIERAHMVAQWQAQHEASGARAGFQLSPQHRRAITEFDADTERKRAELSQQVERARAKIPECEARVARQRAIIGGRERADVIAPTEGPQAEAAD